MKHSRLRKKRREQFVKKSNTWWKYIINYPALCSNICVWLSTLREINVHILIPQHFNAAGEKAQRELPSIAQLEERRTVDCIC